MRMYLIKLTDGGGDTDYKIVDKETWDWIHSNDMGQPANHDSKKDYIWVDQLVPKSQLELMKKEYGKDDFEPEISIGSWSNDRAIFARSVKPYSTYSSVKSVMNALQKNGDELVDEYEGSLY